MILKVKDEIPFAIALFLFHNIFWFYQFKSVSINDKPLSQTVDCIFIKTSFSWLFFIMVCNWVLPSCMMNIFNFKVKSDHFLAFSNELYRKESFFTLL